MADPITLHQSVLALLRGVMLEGTVHDGEAPTDPLTDASGRVGPYVVVWPSPGWEDPAAHTLDHTPSGAIAWTVQVTCAGGTPTRCLQAVHATRTALAGQILTTGASPMVEEPGTPPLTRDDDVRPARWFAPLLFTTQAP